MHLTDHPDFDPADQWLNYGDANPRVHGGRFVTWTGDGWRMIETRDLQEVGPQGMIQGDDRWLFEDYYIEPADVFVDGEVENGLTDAMKKILASFSREHLDPDNYPEEADDTDLAPELIDNLAYYVVDIPHHAGPHGDDSYHANYWSALERYGIDTDEYRD